MTPAQIDINPAVFMRSALRACDKGIGNDASNLAMRQDSSHTRTDVLFGCRAVGGQVVGVDAGTARGNVDERLFAGIRRSHGDVNYHKTMQEVVSRYDVPVADGDSSTLADSLRGFATALQRGASAPSPLRTQDVLTALRGHLDRLREMSLNVQDHRLELDAQVKAQVTQAGSLLQEIAALNRQNASVKGGGSPALQDKRRQLVHDLGALMSVQTFADGAHLNIYTALGVPLVHRETCYKPEYEEDALLRPAAKGALPVVEGMELTEAEPAEGSGRGMSGSIKALLDARDGVLLRRRQDMDAHAAAFAQLCNTCFARGQGGGVLLMFKSAGQNPSDAQSPGQDGNAARDASALILDERQAQSFAGGQSAGETAVAFCSSMAFCLCEDAAGEAANTGVENEDVRDGRIVRELALKTAMEPMSLIKTAETKAQAAQYRFNGLSAVAKDKNGVNPEAMMEHVMELQTWRKFMLDVMYLHNSMSRELSNLIVRS